MTLKMQKLNLNTGDRVRSTGTQLMDIKGKATDQCQKRQIKNKTKYAQRD